MMRFREHRGGLADSMATVVEVADRAGLVKHIARLLAPFNFAPDRIERGLYVGPYAGYETGKPLYDERIKWHTYIVMLEGYGVLGFTDGPC